MMTSIERLSEIEDRLCVMLYQESTVYNVPTNPGSRSPSPSAPARGEAISQAQHEAWRPLILEWAYKLADVLNIQLNAIAAAAHYLDCAVRVGMVAPSDYQLAALTSVHIAIKLYEHRVFPLDDLLQLVREQGNNLTRSDVHAMELNILRALDYHLHPPTAHCFVQAYLDLTLELVDDEDNLESIRSDLEMVAEFFVRDVVKSSNNYSPSVVAYAGLLMALEEYGAEVEVPPSTWDYDDLPSSPRSSLAPLEEPKPSLQQLFVTTLRRMSGLGSDAQGLYDLLANMSNSSSAASTCLVHAQHYERTDEKAETEQPWQQPLIHSPRHVGRV